MASVFFPGIDENEICLPNEKVDTSNSSTAAQACKQFETPESHTRNLIYKSPCDIARLPKAPERKQTNKREKKKDH